MITFLTSCKKAINPIKVAEGAKAMQGIRTGTPEPNSTMMPNAMIVTYEARGSMLAPHTLGPLISEEIREMRVF